MDPKLVDARSLLVLGGARSGKSAYAQGLAESAAPERVYLATAQAGDAEMAARIARHRAERGGGWTTVEEPLALAEALAAAARPGRAALVDCLTLWLTNLMFAGRDVGAEIARLAEVDRRPRRACGPRLQRGRARARAGDEARARVSRLAGPRQSGDRARLATRSCSSLRACRRS